MTNSKAQSTKLVDHIPLQAIKTISLSFQEQEHTILKCPPEVFDEFIAQYTEVEDVNRKLWSSFQRWRVINFLIEEEVLVVENGVLTEVPEVQEAVLAQEGA